MSPLTPKYAIWNKIYPWPLSALPQPNADDKMPMAAAHPTALSFTAS